jgi:hypothetical protein
MKYVFLVFSLLFSVGAFASSANVNPAQPIVMTSDFRNASGEWIQAPWFHANFTVYASETITLTGVKFTITDRQGKTKTLKWLMDDGGVEVMSGTSYTLPLNFIYNIGDINETEFMVHMDYEGWVGNPDEPIGRLNISSDFVTQ